MCVCVHERDRERESKIVSDLNCEKERDREDVYEYLFISLNGTELFCFFVRSNLCTIDHPYISIALLREYKKKKKKILHTSRNIFFLPLAFYVHYFLFYFLFMFLFSTSTEKIFHVESCL